MEASAEIQSVRVPGFRPSVHGFPFPNSYPPDRPFFLFDTPFGAVQFADATRGLCGGMVYAAIDLFVAGLPVPATPTDPVFRRFCRRMFTSWGVPFGWMKYLDWMRRPGASKFVTGVRTTRGLTSLTVETEWPKIRELLDAGQLVPLGLVKAQGLNPRKMGQNHQVLAYGYDASGDDVSLAVYDPNYPGDDGVRLSFSLADPDVERSVVHTCEGPTVRGVFATDYRLPKG